MQKLSDTKVMILDRPNERADRLLEKGWSLIPPYYQRRLARLWSRDYRGMTIQFADLSHYDIAGCHWGDWHVVQYDREIFNSMDDHTALVLITHEIAHEYLCWFRRDVQNWSPVRHEKACRILNMKWHLWANWHHLFDEYDIPYTSFGEFAIDRWREKRALGVAV